jgi:hypothetical protein
VPKCVVGDSSVTGCSGYDVNLHYIDGSNNRIARKKITQYTISIKSNGKLPSKYIPFIA